MRPPEKAVFLNRRVYRLRRIADAARLLPVFGAILFFLPVLWTGRGGTAGGLVYLFLAWLVLIVVSIVLSRKLDPTSDVDMPLPSQPSQEL